MPTLCALMLVIRTGVFSSSVSQISGTTDPFPSQPNNWRTPRGLRTPGREILLYHIMLFERRECAENKHTTHPPSYKYRLTVRLLNRAVSNARYERDKHNHKQQAITLRIQESVLTYLEVRV